MWRLTAPVFEDTFGGIAYYDKNRKEVMFPFPLPLYHYISAALVVAAILIGGGMMLWPMLMTPSSLLSWKLTSQGQRPTR